MVGRTARISNSLAVTVGWYMISSSACAEVKHNGRSIGMTAPRDRYVVI